MALTDTLASSWRRFLDTIRSDDRQRLVEFLRDEYVNEAKDVVQFREHARRMAYPQFRERLLRIADEKQRHVDWLHRKILELGSKVVEPTIIVNRGRNSWECLLQDLEAEKRDAAPHRHKIYRVAQQTDPEIEKTLQRFHEEEMRHRKEIADMLMRSDPQARS